MLCFTSFCCSILKYLQPHIVILMRAWQQVNPFQANFRFLYYLKSQKTENGLIILKLLRHCKLQNTSDQLIDSLVDYFNNFSLSVMFHFLLDTMFCQLIRYAVASIFSVSYFSAFYNFIYLKILQFSRYGWNMF